MFHKEGHTIVVASFLLASIAVIGIDYFFSIGLFQRLLQIGVLVFLVLILQFFRNPKRNIQLDPSKVLAPADGKIVIIKEVFEKEYFRDQRLQVSIFMSPLNVHVTRYPISGKIVFSKYHPGQYLVAWHPKSSELNERTSIVIQNNSFGKILYRQIAGAVVRRIVNYAKVDKDVMQGEDAGFIKFGSRIDLFFPIKTKLNVQLNQKVKGGIDAIVQIN